MRLLLKLFAFIVLIFILLFAGLYFLPDRYYQQVVEKGLERSLGYDITFKEGLRVERGLTTRIHTGEMSFSSNDKIPESRIDFETDKFMIGIDLRSLLPSGILSVESIELGNGRLTVTKLPPVATTAAEPEIVSTEAAPNEAEAAPKKSLTDTIRSIRKRLRVGDVTVERLDINILDIEQTPTITGLIDGLQLIGPSADKKLTSKGNFNQVEYTINGDIKIAETEELDVNLTLGGSNATVSAKLDDAGLLTSNVDINIPLLNEWFAMAGKNIPALGPIKLSAQLNGDMNLVNEGSLNLENVILNVDDEQIKAHVTGEIQSLLASNKLDLIGEINAADVYPLISPWMTIAEFNGSVDSSFTVSGQDNIYQLGLDRLDVVAQDVKLQAKGQVGDVINGGDADIDINLSSNNLDIANLFMDFKMPNWGPIAGSMKLSSKDSNYLLDAIDIKMTGATNATIKGSVPFSDLDNMDLKLTAELATLSDITAFSPSYPLPDLGGPVKATADAYILGGTVGLKNIVGQYKGSQGDIDINGEIPNLFLFKQANLAFDGMVNSVKVGELFAPIKLPDMGPVKISGRLLGGDLLDGRDLHLKDLKARIDKDDLSVDVSGSIDSLVAKKANLNLQTQINAKDADFLKPIINYDALPKIGPFEAQVNLNGNVDDGIAIDLLNGLFDDPFIKGSFSGGFKTKVKKGEKASQITVDLTSSEIERVLNRFNLKTEIKGESSIKATISPIETGVAFDNVEIKVGENYLSSKLRLHKPKDRWSIEGVTNIHNLNVYTLIGQATRAKPTKEEIKLAKKKPRVPVFGDTPFFTSVFKKIDVDLSINVEKATDRFFDFENINTKMISKDGVVKIGPFNAKIAGGKGSGLIESNYQLTPPLHSVDFQVENFSPARFGFFRDSKKINSTGKATLNIDLNLEGSSMDEAMASAAGNTVLFFDNLELDSTELKLLGADFLFELLSKLNPFAKDRGKILFECGVINYKIKQGIAISPSGIAMKAKEFAIIGNSKINLDNEDLHVHLETIATGGISLNLNKIAGIVDVGGKINAPSLELSGKGLITSGLTIGAAIFSGGISLGAQALWDRLQGSKDLCKEALNMTVDFSGTTPKP